MPKSLQSQHVILLLWALKHLYTNSVKIFPWSEPLTLFCLFGILCAWLSSQPEKKGKRKKKTAPAVVQIMDYQHFPRKTVISHSNRITYRDSNLWKRLQQNKATSKILSVFTCARPFLLHFISLGENVKSTNVYLPNYNSHNSKQSHLNWKVWC